MQAKKMLTVLIVSVVAAREPSVAAEKGDFFGRPDFVASRDFSWKSLREPENLFWPAYFWYWNGPPTPDVLRQQLADMAGHEARSVCVVPMPHEFRPVTMNTSMDVDYLSPEFFQRVKVAVDEAARRGMKYWIYDEGGWPSGLAVGRVVQTRPDVAVRVLRCDADGTWTPDIVAKWAPGEIGVPDLLNPESTRTFISLTHERYAAAVGSQFGKAIKMTFTAEPKYQPAGDGRARRRRDLAADLAGQRKPSLPQVRLLGRTLDPSICSATSCPTFIATWPAWDLLSCGKPAIDMGLYYPVRDLWASANSAGANRQVIRWSLDDPADSRGWGPYFTMTDRSKHFVLHAWPANAPAAGSWSQGGYT